MATKPSCHREAGARIQVLMFAVHGPFYDSLDLCKIHLSQLLFSIHLINIHGATLLFFHKQPNYTTLRKLILAFLSHSMQKRTRKVLGKGEDAQSSMRRL